MMEKEQLDKLRAVCPELAGYLTYAEKHAGKHPQISAPILRTIATDLRRLADENKKLREHEWIIKDGFEYCLECNWSREGGHRPDCSWYETPATAGKPKTKEE